MRPSTTTTSSSSIFSEYDDKFNIIFIGDENVGKTSIINRFVNNDFSLEKQKTIGIDSYPMLMQVNNKKVLLKLWDTVGDEKYALMNKSHYSIAHEIICVCAVDNKESFNNLNNWIVNVRELLNNDNVPVFLMANKCDVNAQERVVPKNKLKELAESYGIEYIECSAKENINIIDTINKMVKDIYSTHYSKTNAGSSMEEGSDSSAMDKCSII
jgi:small GTP-binding protein